MSIKTGPFFNLTFKKHLRNIASRKFENINPLGPNIEYPHMTSWLLRTAVTPDIVKIIKEFSHFV